jgi:tRNA threonylcarbamoyladenosine biosynthesis protein TsaB
MNQEAVPMMAVLAVDTSTPYATAAICAGGRIEAEIVADSSRLHAERLLAMLQGLLEHAGRRLGEVNLLAVTRGPGSFTGLRVGVATMKGLAFATGLPLVGVPTLDALSRCALVQGQVCCMLDARMGEVFGAAYLWDGGSRRRIIDEAVAPVGHFLERLCGPVCFIGDGASLYREEIGRALPEARFLPQPLNLPRGGAVAEEALALVAAGASSDAAQVEPVYLRKSQAEQARDARLHAAEAAER